MAAAAAAAAAVAAAAVVAAVAAAAVEELSQRRSPSIPAYLTCLSSGGCMGCTGPGCGGNESQLSQKNIVSYLRIPRYQNVEEDNILRSCIRYFSVYTEHDLTWLALYYYCWWACCRGSDPYCVDPCRSACLVGRNLQFTVGAFLRQKWQR